MTSERVEALLQELTTAELCSLTAGNDMWSTRAVDRVGVPAVRLTDGPNGARGPFHAGEGALTSACVPCGTALGAAWDPDLVEEVGALVADEALTKGSRILLAPTVNLHRSPLAGRNFECFSEDPLLTGTSAAAYIKGAQARGVACTVKHFVGNDAETDRGTIDSRIDERALRELYLRPFELAVLEGGVLGVMTAYNRLNGTWCAEHEWLLAEVLRSEWGFDGFVLTDWTAVGSTAGSMRAGVDLEMPGPGRFYGKALEEAVACGDVDRTAVEAAVGRLLDVLDRIGALDEEPADPASVDRPEHREVARRAAAAGTVLLQNRGILPLDAAGVSSIAVIGPNAGAPALNGGGAAHFHSHRPVTPLEAIRERFAGAEVRYEPACTNGGPLPVLRMPMLVRVFSDEAAREPAAELAYPHTQAIFAGALPGTGLGPYHLRAEGTFTVDETASYTFSLVEGTPVQLLVDGQVLIDSVATPPEPGRFPWTPRPLLAEVDLTAGEHQLLITATGSSLDPTLHPIAGYTVGFRRTVHADGISQAAALAAAADIAVVVVGSDGWWETEAFDRPHMDLRGDQEELIREVAAANENTIVVLNTGSPVTMPWVDEVPAVLQVWFAGQEIGHALADVLSGDVDPGGRLPTTFPMHVEHNPSFGTFPGENGVLRYGEGVFVGYRHYDSRSLPVRFAFGHGLSYTTFDMSEPHLCGKEAMDDLTDAVTVKVQVTNTGSRRGSEVVQCYVAPPSGRRPRPAKELRAFRKVTLDPGEVADVELVLDTRSFARWDPALPDHDFVHARLDQTYPDVSPPPGPATGRWIVDPGTYRILVGRSSVDIVGDASLVVPEERVLSLPT